MMDSKANIEGMDIGQSSYQNLNEDEMNDISIDVESFNEETDPTEGVEASSEWCFETDQAVLKNHKDYNTLLRTVAVLEAQRIQAVNDLDTLMQIRNDALSDPMAFVRKMESQEGLGIPPRIVPAELPILPWDEINAANPTETLKHVTRKALRTPVDIKVEECQEEKQRIRIRGRAYDNSKPQTFNQLWTSEEQHRLEELLTDYPPEEVETKRWGKIAAALGNRTGKQVSSRVQKYFIKLHRAGLPVPGRIPKVVGMGHRHLHQRNNHLLFKPTTFFPIVPRMGDDSDQSDSTIYPPISNPRTYPVNDGGGEDMEIGDDEVSDDDEDDATMHIQEKVAAANSSRVMNLLKLVSEEKDVSDRSTVKHFGYKCDFCHEEPLIGTRWNCSMCTHSSIDFCSECVVTQIYSTTPHPPAHSLQPIRTLTRPKTYDQDYTTTSTSGCGYNYLDPNYMPINDE